MVNASTRDVDAVTAAVRQRLAGGWTRWPGGYPDDIELALVDAVFSIRARYGKGRTEAGGAATGVRAVVGRWRDHRGGAAGDLRQIVQAGDEFARIVGNRSQTSGRTKASAAQEAAQRLSEAGIWSAANFKDQREVARRAYVGVRGLSWVTFSYLSMLLGQPDVQADTWVTRFVREAVGAPFPIMRRGVCCTRRPIVSPPTGIRRCRTTRPASTTPSGTRCGGAGGSARMRRSDEGRASSQGAVRLVTGEVSRRKAAVHFPVEVRA